MGELYIFAIYFNTAVNSPQIIVKYVKFVSPKAKTAENQYPLSPKNTFS